MAPTTLCASLLCKFRSSPRASRPNSRAGGAIPWPVRLSLNPWGHLGKIFQGNLARLDPTWSSKGTLPSVDGLSWRLMGISPLSATINNIFLLPQNCLCLFWKLLLASLTTESPMAKPTFIYKTKQSNHRFVSTSFLLSQLHCLFIFSLVTL